MPTNNTQTMGLAMGSPLSPILAEYVMNLMDREIINSCPVPVIFYKRYVDDSILCIPSNTHNQVLDHFNKFNTNVQFTLQVEEDNKLNFLDLTVSINKKSGMLETNWFQKLVSSGRYLNYLSESPLVHKRGTVYSLVDRCYHFSSNKDFHFNLKKITNLLLENNYPLNFIECNIKQRLKKLNFEKYNALGSCDNKNKTSRNITKKYISIPYMNKFSESIANKMKKFDLNVAFKTNNFTGQFFSKVKDKIDTLDQTHIVYQINCNECDAKYIGQTKQKFGKRLNQHKNSIKNTDKTGSSNHTALCEHTIKTKHTFDFHNPKILKKECHYQKRLVNEMIEIKRQKDAINFRTDIQNLSMFYNNII